MTLIELFDKSAIDNVAPALCCKPDRVIFIGENGKLMKKRIPVYREIFEKNGINCEIFYKSLNKNKLNVAVEHFSKFVEEYGDCVFDLTGGGEIYLVAVGIVLDRYKDKAKCHRYNVQNEKLIDTDSDGIVCACYDVSLTVEDDVKIYGGKVIKGNDIFSTYSWDFTDELRSDVFSAWEICRKDAKRWNTLIGALGEMCGAESSSHLSVQIPVKSAITISARWKLSYKSVIKLLSDFQKRGFINGLSVEKGISFNFKNESTRHLLSVAGQLLELVVAFRMKEAIDENGKPLYDDVKVGVVVGWDTDDGDTEKDMRKTINEIDVFAMKGALPVFVSCKNGNFDNEELYKLNSVASRFGFDYAAKAIISTEFDKIASRESLEARASDMGIRILKNVDEIDEEEWNRLIRTLWKK